MKEGNNFIPGIYNWCDRWCEHCPLTHKCRNFYMQQQRKTEDFQNELPDELDDNLSESLFMFEQMADELGFSLDTTQEESESIHALEEAQEILIDSHPLVEMAEFYFKKGKEWVDLELFTNDFGALKFISDTHVLNAEELESHLNLIGDAMEVVEWYLFFIPGKIKRSLQDQMDDFWNQFPEEERSDLGSAKIAILSIERSIEAWATIHKFFPKDERIVELVANLEKLRSGMVEVFPNYLKFIRPGFDSKE
jgi:hypothetical protein